MTATERALTAIGLLTWIASGMPTLLFLLSPAGASAPWAIPWAVTFLLFGVCFWTMTRNDRPSLGLIIVGSGLALTVVTFGRSGLDPILLVIIAAVGGGRLAVSGVATLIATQTAILTGIEVIRFGTRALPSVGAYFGFMVFAAITAMIAENEKRAREELAKTNAELQTALALLDISTRAAERSRIGRDLHDVVGHHLAALSLQLEVASHVSGDERTEHVRKAQTIAKLLLSDVRGVVSDLRSEEPIDLVRALQLIVTAITTPRIEIEAPDSLLVGDPLVAQTALRSLQEIITNATRHSSAESLVIRIGEADSSLEIDAVDDGLGVTELKLGNGLKGMRERVESTGGSLQIRTAPGEGFTVEIRLPMGEMG